MSNLFMKRYFIVGLACLFSTVLHAQSLTWEDCTAQAKANNPDIKAALLVLEKAKLDVSAAKAVYFPTVSLTAQHSQPFLSSNSASDSFGISASQQLFPLFASNPTLERSLALLEGQQAVLQQTLASSYYDLFTAYTAHFFSQSKLDLVDKIAKRRKQNLALVKAKFESGYENKGAYLRSNAQYESAKADVNQAKRELELAQDNLARLMGVKKETTFSTKKPVVSKQNTALISDDTLPTLPNLKQTKASLLASFYQEKSIGQAYQPILSASLSYDKLFPETTQPSLTGRLGLSVPLLTWGKDDIDVKNAKMETERLTLVYQSLIDQTRFSVKQLYFQVISASENIEVQTLFEQAASTRSEIAQKSYQAGLLSFENWDIIESDWITQQQRSLSGQKAMLDAVAAYEKTLGKGFN
jgi:outer membrane protein TolC